MSGRATIRLRLTSSYAQAASIESYGEPWLPHDLPLLATAWQASRRGPPCISATPTALDRYLAALPAMSLIPRAPFTKLSAWQASDDPPSFDFRRDKGLRRASNEVN
jgi:hypothetical protein